MTFREMPVSEGFIAVEKPKFTVANKMNVTVASSFMYMGQFTGDHYFVSRG